MLTDLAGVTSTLPSTMTGTTTTTVVRPSIHVLGGVLVALRAVSTSGMAVPSVSNSVESVRGLGIPSKILDSVVGGVSVVMAGLHPLGARSDEGFQDKPVDEEINHLPVSRQSEPQVTSRHGARDLHPPTPNVCSSTSNIRPNTISTSDTSEVRDLITREADDRLPNL